MIKIPESSFKEILADENDPFIRMALNPRKHYDLCWCGSDKKYKKCHRVRQFEEPLPLSQVLHKSKEIFWRKRGCMHPCASAIACKGPIIDAHTIQRKGPLATIVDARNHVETFEIGIDGTFSVTPIGWKRASTFPGFCAHHDSTTFALLEIGGFSGEHEECVLQAFRSASNELYKKKALIETFEYYRCVIDRGAPPHLQIERQLSIEIARRGQTKSMHELERWSDRLSESIRKSDYDQFSSRIFPFTGNIDMVSSAALHAEFDFNGNKLVDMWDLDLDAEILSHSVMTFQEGGAIVFVWSKDSRDALQIVESFAAIPDQYKGDVFAQYCFLNAENTFFSSDWWRQLSCEDRNFISSLAPLTFYDGGKFESRANRLVSWKFR